jgi:hypothetical protein
MANAATAILTFNKNPNLILFIIKLEIKVEIPTTNPPIILSLNMKLYFAPQFLQAKSKYPFQKAIKTTLDDKGVLHFSHFSCVLI